MQEARLQQLSMDLKSDLNASSLTQLKELVSDFMQQLKDSMARQTQTQTRSQTLIDTPAQLQVQAQTQAQKQAQTQPSLAVTLQPEPLSLLDTTGLPSSSSPQAEDTYNRRLHSQSGQGDPPDQLSRRRPASSPLQGSDNEMPSYQQSRAQSVIAESEIELDLPESQASSVIEEEVGMAAADAAESVAESVSDFQYSMEFDSSIHRSPLSAFRSPTSGELAEDDFTNMTKHERDVHICMHCLSVCPSINNPPCTVCLPVEAL